MAGTRTIKVDFFCATHRNQKRHELIDNLFDQINERHCTEAIPLEDNSDELFQFRNVARIGRARIVTAVFGRNRLGEKLTQGDHTGEEEDVELRPGYGLVEKNHLLFVPSRNLIVWQRHASGSHHSKLQAYINRMVRSPVILEPILTPDAYHRLIQGGALKSFELSLTPPADAAFYRDVLSQHAMQLVHECGAIRANIKLSVGRSGIRMPEWIKEALGSWARSGLARVAKAKVEDEETPIDLVGSRLVHSVSVPLGADKKVSPRAVYSALETARTERRAELDRYFAD